MVTANKSGWRGYYPHLIKMTHLHLPWMMLRNAVITQYNIRLVQIANASSGDDRFLGPDFYTFFYDDTSLYADHIHPNDLGYQRMGDKWYDILRFP